MIYFLWLCHEFWWRLECWYGRIFGLSVPMREFFLRRRGRAQHALSSRGYTTDLRKMDISNWSYYDNWRVVGGSRGKCRECDEDFMDNGW